VKNHDYTPKNLIFSNFRGGARRVRPPPWIRPCNQLQPVISLDKMSLMIELTLQ
jgi:hypothetical protein